MPQIINTNIASINAQRNLNKSQSDYQTALQRLSSGLRINSAKDDAAGLAISTRIETQTAGLAVAIRNAGDGVSLAQTAEGALGSMTGSLQRIRDLALESANATNSNVDRQALNQEVQQLKDEIKRVSDQTNFNGTKLLDGTFQDVTFQIGANRGESVTFGIAPATTDKLGAAQTDGISSNPNNNALNAGDLVINGIAVPASSGANDSYSYANSDGSAIAKAAAINSVTDQTGVKAVVNANSVGGSTGFDNTSGNATIKINNVSVSLVTSSTLSDKVNLENIAAAINDVSGQTGVKAITSGDAKTGIELVAADGRNITIDASGAGAKDPAAYGLTDIGYAGGTTTKTISGSFTLVSPDGSDISLDTTTGNISNAGLQVGTFSGNNSGAVSADENGSAMQTGDLVINGVPVGGSTASDDTASPDIPSGARATSAIAKAAAINKVSGQTGVTAKANETIYNGSTISTSTAADVSDSFKLNNVTIDVSWAASASSADRQRAIVTAVNNKAGQTGVSAEAFGNSFRLIANDGRNIVLSNFSGTNSSADIGFVDSSGLTINATNDPNGYVQRGSISLQSAGQIDLATLTGNIANSGFQVGSYGSTQDGETVDQIDISTVKGALKAITSVDNALNQINFQRAQLGAIQNRFDSTISNQQITSENLTSADSRIKDADFAKETAALSRAQVLQQAGLSILAQANAQPQQVLKLLQ